MRNIILIIGMLLISISISGQNKRDYQWFFGSGDMDMDTPGVQSYKFDFNHKPFEVEKTDLGYPFDNLNASICDEEGNLLFYSNGCAVMNAAHEVMPNGDSINAGAFFEILWNGDCKNGYPGTQDIIMLTDPGNADGYYVLHKKKEYVEGEGSSNPKGIRYSYVDMSKADNLGDVVIKNERFTANIRVLSSYLTAIEHSNGIDWWIVQPVKDDDYFMIYLLDLGGFHRMEDQEMGYDVNWKWASSSGTSKFSPDGTKYAMYNFYDQLHVYDFDRLTGIMSNHQQVEILESTTSEIRYSSVEWSPNSRFIYTASTLELHQIDTWETDMEDGIVLIDTYDGTQNPFSNTFYLMAQGPDCRIYMCSTSGNKTYHVINEPDEKGLACAFDQNGLELIYNAGFGSMPNHPRWRVDEEEKCDPTIVSVFGIPVYTRKDLEVYPNPTIYDYVNIRIPSYQAGTIEIRDEHGRIVGQESVMTETLEHRINLSGYNTGIYYVEFVPKDKSSKMIYTTKLEKLN